MKKYKIKKINCFVNNIDCNDMVEINVRNMVNKYIL